MYYQCMFIYTGQWQPRPAWPRLHLLAAPVHRSRRRQGGGAGREAAHLWGDGPHRADTAGRTHLPHLQSGFRVPQTTQLICGGQGIPQEGPTPKVAVVSVIFCPYLEFHSNMKIFLFVSLKNSKLNTVLAHWSIVLKLLQNLKCQIRLNPFSSKPT